MIKGCRGVEIISCRDEFVFLRGLNLELKKGMGDNPRKFDRMNGV